MDYNTVVDSLRLIAEPAEITLDYTGSGYETSSGAPVFGLPEQLRECGWNMASLFVNMHRCIGLKESLVGFLDAGGDRPSVYAGHIATCVIVEEILSELPDDEQRRARFAAADEYRIATASAPSSGDGPFDAIAWVNFAATNLNRGNCEPFCFAMRTRCIPIECGYILAAGVAADVCMSDTCADFWRHHVAGGRDMAPLTRARLETAARTILGAVVAAVANAVATAPEPHLPPVIV